MLKSPATEPQRAPPEAAWDRLRSAEPARVDDPLDILRAVRTAPARGRSKPASRVRSR